jgi:deoxyribodipyrimidine photo-lyase
MKIGLFIFTRDLRLEDNTTLNYALTECDVIIPSFIFNPIQIDKNKNKFYNEHCVNFMYQCLYSLDKQLHKLGSRLFYFYGKHDEVVNKLITRLHLTNVYLNSDVTLYSKKREKDINKICKKHNINLTVLSDLFLLETPLEKHYSMFTSYFNHLMKKKIKKPNYSRHRNFYKKTISGSMTFKYPNIDSVMIGGRKDALKKLFMINIHYDSNKKDHTSNLSPYLKFGCISSREVYWYIKRKFGNKLNNSFIRQLIWRDFYYQLFLNNPELFLSNLPKIKWKNNKTLFKKWCKGKTGYPIIDAAMRELNSQGTIHNRLRLVVSCFLVKILYIDWRWGEKWFAQKLLDYDPILNNANWQWIAGSLPGSRQPWFVIINPWIQSKKFDKDCSYIKQWVPELKAEELKIIHTKIYKPIN